MNLAMICAKIGLDLSKVEKNTKKHAIFCSILTFLLIFQFQQNFSAKHCKINISYTFLVLLTPLSPLYLLKQWQKRNRDISVSVQLTKFMLQLRPKLTDLNQILSNIGQIFEYIWCFKTLHLDGLFIHIMYIQSA